MSNQNLLAAEAQFRQARAVVGSARAALFPQVAVGVSFARSHQSGTLHNNLGGSGTDVVRLRDAAERQLGARPLGPHSPQRRVQRGQRPGVGRRRRVGAPQPAGRARVELLPAPQHRRRPRHLRQQHRGIRALAEADAQPLRRRHRVARRRRPGADPAREHARAGDRSRRAARRAGERHRRPDRRATGGLLAARHAARRRATVDSGRRALTTARAPPRHRRRRAHRGGGQRPGRRGHRRLLSDRHAQRLRRLRELAHRPMVHLAEPLLFGRSCGLGDHLRRRLPRVADRGGTRPVRQPPSPTIARAC